MIMGDMGVSWEQFVWGGFAAMVFSMTHEWINWFFSTIKYFVMWPFLFLWNCFVHEYTFDANSKDGRAIFKVICKTIAKHKSWSTFSLFRKRGFKIDRRKPRIVDRDCSVLFFYQPSKHTRTYLPWQLSFHADTKKKHDETPSPTCSVIGFRLTPEQLVEFLNANRSKKTCLEYLYGSPIPTRETSDLFYPADILEECRAHIAHFLLSSQTKTKHTGILLHGPPGTGKTSLVHKMSQEFHMNIYPYKIGQFGAVRFLCDKKADDRIVLLDDVDLMVKQHLSELLELLELQTSSKTIFMVTTNFEKHLPNNMKRDGRIDLSLHITRMNENEARFMVERYYPLQVQLIMDKIQPFLPVSPCTLSNLLQSRKGIDGVLNMLSDYFAEDASFYAKWLADQEQKDDAEKDDKKCLLLLQQEDQQKNNTSNGGGAIALVVAKPKVE